MKRDLIEDAEDHISLEAMAAARLRLAEPGHILLVVRGMILAHTIPVAINTQPVTINQDMKALRPRSEVDGRFLAYLLRGLSQQLFATIEESGHGTRALRLDLWKTCKVRVPPPNEQQSIVAFLDRKTAQIDSVIGRLPPTQGDGKLAAFVNLLIEYRQTLISAAVTGKLTIPQKATA